MAAAVVDGEVEAVESVVMVVVIAESKKTFESI